METQNAIKLVKELKNNRLIPKFNENLIQNVSNEINL